MRASLYGENYCIILYLLDDIFVVELYKHGCVINHGCASSKKGEIVEIVDNTKLYIKLVFDDDNTLLNNST